LVHAIRAVANGKRYIPPEVGTKIAESLPRTALTTREIDVLQSVATGLRNKGDRPPNGRLGIHRERAHQTHPGKTACVRSYASGHYGAAAWNHQAMIPASVMPGEGGLGVTVDGELVLPVDESEV
jgi:hypothetical protein